MDLIEVVKVEIWWVWWGGVVVVDFGHGNIKVKPTILLLLYFFLPMNLLRNRQIKIKSRRWVKICSLILLVVKSAKIVKINLCWLRASKVIEIVKFADLRLLLKNKGLFRNWLLRHHRRWLTYNNTRPVHIDHFLFALVIYFTGSHFMPWIVLYRSICIFLLIIWHLKRWVPLYRLFEIYLHSLVI